MMNDKASSTFIGDNTYGSTLNQGSIVTGDSSHVGNVNHFHAPAQQVPTRTSFIQDLLAALVDDPDDYRQTLEERKGPRTKGTCWWIVKSSHYKSWLNNSPGLLWISGDAGKGKTMLALHLVSLLKNQPSAGHVVHFFCSRDRGKNTGASILRGIIYQLIDQQPSLFEHALDDYDKHGPSLFDDRKFQALWAIFARILVHIDTKPVTCVLDGLDECDEDGLNDFLIKIRNLYDSNSEHESETYRSSLRLIVVSRNHPYSIKQALETFTRLRLEPDYRSRVESDISKFIDDRISSLRCPRELSAYIGKKLRDQSEGTYLWVSFAINALKKVRTIDMEKTVDSFPRGLDAMYRRMWSAISEHDRVRVVEILHWVTTTSRPLTLRELATAISTSPARGQTLEDAISDEIAYAGDLLMIVKTFGFRGFKVSRRPKLKDSVLPVHSSVLDFFQSTPEHDPDTTMFRIQPAITHDLIARRLFDYAYEVLQTIGPVRFCVARAEESRLKKEMNHRYPLLRYALYEGLRHFSRSGNIHRIDNYHPILDPVNQHHTRWLQLQARVVCGHHPEEGVKLAHIVALHGLLEILEHTYCQSPSDLDKIDSMHRTVLFYATLQSQLHVIEWLLFHGADPNARDYVRQIPLHIAAHNGRLDVIQTLIRHGSRASTQTGHKITKHASMLEGLVDHYNDVTWQESPDWMPGYRWSGTPAHIAATVEEPKALKILLNLHLQEGGSINETDENGRTILHNIATGYKGGLRPCYEVLMESSKPPNLVSTDMLDANGETALHIATRQCCSRTGPGRYFTDDFDEHMNCYEPIWNSVIELVDTFGANVNVQGTWGETALHFACKKGIASLAKYLLGRGADARLYDMMGQNALHWLCNMRQETHQDRPTILACLTAKMTLEDIEAKDRDGLTAYDYAVKFDAEYLEIERRFEQGLHPHLQWPASLTLDGDKHHAYWLQHGHCQAFEELHRLIDCSLTIIKGEGSKEDLDFLQRIVCKHPHLQHWLDKRRRYQESKENDFWLIDLSNRT